MQIAHAGGWGGYDPATDDSLSAFADAIEHKVLKRDAIYFDLSAVVRGSGKPKERVASDWWPERRYQRLAERMRKIGIDHFVFGTDAPEWPENGYRDSIAKEVPLSPSDLQAVLRNHAPWLGERGQTSDASGGPAYERRDQSVDQNDLRILERANTILATEAQWNRTDNRECPEPAQKWSLFCALKKASIEVLGAATRSSMAA